MVNSLAIAVMCLAAFGPAYFLYSRFLSRRIFQLDPKLATPSHRFEDGLDYVPANRFVLFGHHFSTIAGLRLLLATVYLYRQGRPIVYTLVPMLIVFAFTLTAVVIKLYQFFMEGSWSVFWVGLAVLVLAVWL